MSDFLASYGKWHTWVGTACLLVICVPLILLLIWTGQQALADPHSASNDSGTLTPQTCTTPQTCSGVLTYAVNTTPYTAHVIYDPTKVKAGTGVQVFYNPKNPTSAVVQRVSALQDFGLALLLILVLVGAVWWARKVGQSRMLSTYAGISDLL